MSGSPAECARLGRALALRTWEYAHVYEESTGVTELYVGPLNRKLNVGETIVLAPTPFAVVPPMHYAMVSNPIAHQEQPSGSSSRDSPQGNRSGRQEEAQKKPLRGKDGQVQCRLGERELRYSRDPSRVLPPFPLYPDEKLEFIKPMEVIKATEYLVIHVLCDYELTEEICSTGEHTGAKRMAGDVYTLRGPAVYLPRLDEEIVRREHVLSIPPNGFALHCRALRTFTRPERLSKGGATVSVQSVITGGAEYLYTDAGDFVPSPYEQVVQLVAPQILGQDQGFHIEVTKDYTDPRPYACGVQRRAGDCFMVTCDECRCFPLHPYDVIKARITRITVTEHQYCIVITNEARTIQSLPPSTTHHADTAEEVSPPTGMQGQLPSSSGGGSYSSTAAAVAERPCTEAGLMSRGYQQHRVLTNTSFFLAPGETLQCPPRPVYVLTEDQAVLLTALEDFFDTEDGAAKLQGANTADRAGGTARAPIWRVSGDRWLVRGPRRFIPSHHVRVLWDPRTNSDVRERVILTEGEGLYVRHTTTGVVRLIAGPTSYMLEADEELWEKPLPPHVERRLEAQLPTHVMNTLVPAALTQERILRTPPLAAAVKSSVAPLSGKGCGGSEAPMQGLLQGKTVHGVVYHIPNRCVTQLFNYRTQRIRTIFGPDRVLLEPDESFTVVSLSGSPWDPELPNKCLPKEPNRITALYLYLGPSNMTDVMQVETSDHARLSLQLCYDWYFDIQYGDAAAASKCFVVNDFVGNTCSFIASRVRSAVASLPFEQFHKRSTEVLREAVFGVDPTTGKPAEELRFEENYLVITTVDIQEMQVLDARTLRGLRKAVEMAIEITTHAQEVQAQQVALVREQEARGLLDRKRMSDQVDIEEQRGVLLETERKVLSIVSSSKSTAAAHAMAEAARVESEAAVAAAKVRTERELVVNKTLVEAQRKRREAVKDQEAKMAKEAADFHEALENVRLDLLEKVVAALGPETITELAKAGPELQATLLKSMGLEGYLVTDGSTPINLFQTAKGLTGETTVGDEQRQ